MARATLLVFAVSLFFLITAAQGAAGVVSVNGVCVWSGDSVLEHVRDTDGGSFIDFPGTLQWALEGRVEDFRPMSLETVIEAVGAVDYPIENLGIQIVILPVPRRLLPESSAEGRVIFLSPGTTDYPEVHIHYIVAHEIGHAVQHLLMPESRSDMWRAYAKLRGIDLQGAGTPPVHSSRPAEIFAEDFRVLFGGALARFGGNIENHGIMRPEDVVGLREFMLSLPGVWEGNIRISASPNPFETSVAFEAFSLDDRKDPLEVKILDVRGRLVTALGPTGGEYTTIVWDGRDPKGRDLGPGVYFALVGSGKASVAYKLIKR